MIHPTVKVSEKVNRKLPARNTHDGTRFSPLHQPWAPQCTASQTDRQKDGRTDGPLRWQ